MSPEEVIEFFGGKTNTAKTLAVSYQAVQQWQKSGVIPATRQFQIEVLSNGTLKADQPPTESGEAA